MQARSELRFPTLAPPSCPWHSNCTPMDCENYRRAPWMVPHIAKHKRRSFEHLEAYTSVQDDDAGSGAAGVCSRGGSERGGR